MALTQFEIAWKRFYPNHRPMGWKMRTCGAAHHLRFHSLPASKRYAETGQESQIILSRQNQLAGEVLGLDQPRWLVQACWETSPGMIDVTAHLDLFWACREYDLPFSFQFEDEDQSPYSIYARTTFWREGAFDKLLLAIADEWAADTLWMSESGAVFAPYDGGVDLFLPDPLSVEKLMAEHAEWLPP